MGVIMKIHLGVLEVPYTDSKKPISTGDVAEILEKRYAVMQGFVSLHLPDIAAALERSYAGGVESLLMGAPTNDSRVLLFGKAENDIEQMFRHYLDAEEILQTFGVPGLGKVPTQAALDGVSKRFKRLRGPRRPSFIDSGLYQNSFRAWVDA
jgi:hypothetical protein